LASNLSGVTGNILLHWMQTRWMTGLTTAPGWGDLPEPAEAGADAFSGMLSAFMSGF